MAVSFWYNGYSEKRQTKSELYGIAELHFCRTKEDNAMRNHKKQALI